MKIFTLVFILLLGIGNIYGQGWEELNAKAVDACKVGNYSAAIDYGKKAVTATEKRPGKYQSDYTICLNNLAWVYQTMGDYNAALLLYKQALEIREKALGKENVAYVYNLNKLGVIYYTIGDYAAAEPFYKEALEIRKKMLGEEHADYAASLHSLALVYEMRGNYTAAEAMLKQAIQIREKISGKENVLYAYYLNSLAGIYFTMGKYTVAEPLYKQALEIRKTVLGEEDPDYARSLQNLAASYVGMGNYTAAEPLYKQALEIYKQALGEKHSDYIFCLINLGALYVDMGNYTTAEPLYKQALETYKASGEENAGYAYVLANLGMLYESKGNYATAEPFYKQALEMRKKVLGVEHPDYASSLSNLAGLYYYVGNYTAAELLWKQGVEAYKKISGVEHPDYIITLSNLAGVYYTMENYTAATPLLEEVLELRKKVLGKEHPMYAQSLCNLAGAYSKAGNDSVAEGMYKQAMEIFKKASGVEHPDYAHALNNLAWLYKNAGNYAAAEPLYKQSMEIRKSVLGEEHPEYAQSLTNLASLYNATGNYAAAEPLYKQALNVHTTQLANQLGFLSEAEQSKYIESIESVFASFQSYALRRYATNPAIAADVNNLVLSVKGLQLQAGIQMRQSILSGGDTTSVQILEQWTATRQSLAKLYGVPINKRTVNTDSLEQRADELEKQLTRLSASFKKMKQQSEIKTADIQAKLKTDEAAIEFTRFTYYNGKKYTDSVLYVAHILRAGSSTPVSVPLFEEKQLSDLFQATQKSVGDKSSVEQLYAERGATGVNDLKTTTNTYGNKLYQLLWSRMEPYLKGVKTICYSPAGMLHRVSFAAIPVDATMLLSDKYNLVTLGSTRQVALEKEQAVLNAQMAVNLYGGINYDMAPAEMSAAAQQQKSVTEEPLLTENTSGLGYSIRGDAARGSGWTYLAGTGEEVKQINTLLNGKGISTTGYTGNNAVEDIFKSLQGKQSPAVIHIATHGFFYPTDTGNQKGNASSGEERIRTAENPLLRTGLIFAGGNNKWKNDDVQLPANTDDGILTAYEVANMDLSQTKLAVLSACQTGLGDIKGSEGVYGLQRAFMMAGVKNLMISLWSVPDEATRDFMTTFYTYWATGATIEDSFNRTQHDMKAKYKAPYYWAAFVLVR